ncbi:uncharacterized protein LOC106657059 isoform X2 [Trichogramma pretiosum]|nr:uncharacterized protein LOC106657059 isoform X2 [Trichogramma pretiosum]
MGRLYTIEHPGKSRVMIKADSIEGIKSAAIEKFKLSGEKSYKLLLMPDHIEMDDDEILFEYTMQQGNTAIVFRVVDAEFNIENNSEKENDAKENNKNDENALVPMVPNNGDVRNELVPRVRDNEGAQNPPIVSVKEGIWDKIPGDILNDLNAGRNLRDGDRNVVLCLVRDYMYYGIKDCRRSKAMELAQMLCAKYPASFSATVGTSKQTFGNGYEDTFDSLYNKVMYKKWSDEQEKKRTRNSNESSDSEEEQVIKKKQKITKFDVYGCEEYAPPLPEAETLDTQETTRLQLLDQYKLENTENVDEMMMKCYPTIRMKLNEKPDLLDIEKDWPFLQTPEFFLQHCNRLLGKNVVNTWTTSLQKKCSGINDFMRQCKSMKKKETFKKVRKEFKAASETRRDQIPTSIGAILSVIIYFSEDEKLLYKILSNAGESSDDSDISPYPFLEVQGDSLYDELAVSTVIIDGKYKIKTNDVVEGLLITFLAYYVYGIMYPSGLAKTLEFIQRLFMDINPTEGSKFQYKKKKNFNAGVRKLSNLLDEFTENFTLT